MTDISFEIGRLFAGSRMRQIAQGLAYAGLKAEPYSWVGSNMILAALLTSAISAAVFLISSNIIYAAAAAGFAAVSVYLIVSTIVSILSNQRARFVEQTLPDALLLMASNVRSGMATDEAVLLSARPEFGFLADKLKEAGRRIATGDTFAAALNRMTVDVDSSILRKTVSLIIEGLESGGEMAVLLEETATDIRDNDILQREVRAVILVYALFIFVAAVITAPVLYAISSHLAETLSRLSTAISVAFITRGTPGIKIQPSEIPPGFLVDFAYVNLIITAIFGALMVAMINRGNERYGIRYIPVFIAISLGIFFVTRIVVGQFFGAIRV